MPDGSKYYLVECYVDDRLTYGSLVKATSGVHAINHARSQSRGQVISKMSLSVIIEPDSDIMSLTRQYLLPEAIDTIKSTYSTDVYW